MSYPTLNHQLAFELITQSRGSLKAQMLWNSWDDQQRDEAATVAAQIRPVLEQACNRLAEWLDAAAPNHETTQ